MKKLLFTFGLTIFSLSLLAQTDDPVIMIIAGKPVTRSEFEYNYNKNNTAEVTGPKDIEEYVPLFVNYKLKVQAAEDASLDTLTSFNKEFRTYRDQQIRPLLVTPEEEEKEYVAYYNDMVKQLDGHDLRFPAHIVLAVPQNSTEAVQTRQKERIDSIYAALQAGADFAELARTCSDDKQSGQRGGDLQWFGPGQMFPQLETVLYSLNKGEYSEPVLTPVGYHIVLLKDTKEVEPYDTLRPQIQRFLESRGMRDRLSKQILDSLSSERSMTVNEVLDSESDRLCEQDSDLKYLVQEYHDGLLLYELCKTQVWDPASTDTVALEAYYKEHKKQYDWDTPHFYGMVYYCANPADVKEVKKLLKGVPENKWARTIREHLNKDSVTVRSEMRLFAKGDNAFVDSLIFKTNTGKARPRKDFPYMGVIGRKLKKGPQKWTDVGGLVVSDYQTECDEKFAEGLRKRYEVVVIPEVVATVNKH